MTAFVSISITGNPSEVAQVLFTIASRLNQPYYTATPYKPPAIFADAPRPQLQASPGAETTPAPAATDTQPTVEPTPPSEVQALTQEVDWTPILVTRFLANIDEKTLNVLRFLKSTELTGSSHQAITLRTQLTQRQIATVASYTSRKINTFRRQHSNIVLPRPFAINPKTKLYHIAPSFGLSMI